MQEQKRTSLPDINFLFSNISSGMNVSDFPLKQQQKSNKAIKTTTRNQTKRHLLVSLYYAAINQFRKYIAKLNIGMASRKDSGKI